MITEIQKEYSNEVGAHVERIIRRLESYKSDINNITIRNSKRIPIIEQNIDFLIPSVNAPIILIESSYIW
jgi:hypothetical protein